MGLLRGIDILLYDKQPAGYADGFGKPVMEEVPTVIHNVLIAPTTAADLADRTDPEKYRIVFKLGIPKGDAHEWLDRRVQFFGNVYHTFGGITEGIESMVPTDWHKTILCGRNG